MRYQHVLVPTDGSEISARAMHAAIELAKCTKGVIYALAVNEPLECYPGSYDGIEGTIPYWPQEFQEAAERISAWRVAFILAAAAEAGVDCKTVVVTDGNVSEAILDAATEHGIDTIVMASHGRRGLSALLLGSVTNRVVTKSSVPVLVVK
ncbi:hypothetical protein M885DRAFT_561130 [Pelagophyceae sp. CCMP2097]|nr:hypothetical protein M885DRAFT_561130 [Pelagophyceae sp. CCMP2097]